MPLLLLAVLALLAPETRATLTIYTDRATFLTDVAGLAPQTLDFESETAGSTLPDPTAIAGITFSGFAAPPLIIDDTYDASSGDNYLGLDSPGTFNQFSYADLNVFDMGFASKNAIGLNIITSEVPGVSLFDDDIRIDVPGIGVASIDADTVDALTAGGDRIYFLGIIDTVNSFTTAQLEGSGAFGFFNVDDISTAAVIIPEPGVSKVMVAFLPILFAAGWWRRSTNKRSLVRSPTN